MEYLLKRLSGKREQGLTRSVKQLGRRPVLWGNRREVSRKGGHGYVKQSF